MYWYDDPYAKFRRAGEYLHKLYDGIAAFVESDPYDVAPKLDSDGWHRGRFHIIRTPPEDFALLLGDFIQNLRASLDHSVYALATTKAERTEYPIHLQKGQYFDPSDPLNPKSSAREITLAHVADEYRAVIDASQPYNRGDVKAARQDPLAILAWLSNMDKHRLIHPAFHRQMGAPSVRLKRGRLSDIRIRKDIPLNQAVGEGTVVYAWRPKPGKEQDVHVDVAVVFTVAFSDRALDYVELEAIWNYVSRVINTLRAVSEGRNVEFDRRWPPPRSPIRPRMRVLRPIGMPAHEAPADAEPNA